MASSIPSSTAPTSASTSAAPIFTEPREILKNEHDQDEHDQEETVSVETNEKIKDYVKILSMAISENIVGKISIIDAHHRKKILSGKYDKQQKVAMDKENEENIFKFVTGLIQHYQDETKELLPHLVQLNDENRQLSSTSTSSTDKPVTIMDQDREREFKSRDTSSLYNRVNSTVDEMLETIKRNKLGFAAEPSVSAEEFNPIEFTKSGEVSKSDHP